MNNEDAQETIESCRDEFKKIDVIIQSCGSTSPMSSYLSRFSLILACGTIEYSVKAILADVHIGASKQLCHFIDVKVRDNSMNPSLENICSTLKNFDEDWLKTFKRDLKANTNQQRICDSLKSLVSLRNQLAHGKRAHLLSQLWISILRMLS